MKAEGGDMSGILSQKEGGRTGHVGLRNYEEGLILDGARWEFFSVLLATKVMR